MALERFANTPTPATPATPWTTLNGAITSGALSLTVASASPFPSSAQFRILIDSEWMLVTAGAGTTTWTVTRGIEGSTATAHANGASIYHVVTAAALLRNSRSMTTLGDMEYMAADLGPARLVAPADGDYVTRWASGVPSWIVASGGAPGGSSGQFQYNNAGAFGGNGKLAATVTGIGTGVLAALTSGTNNVAIGDAAAAGLTTGSTNVAIGSSALAGVETGGNNVAIGVNALASAGTGVASTIAIGRNALRFNTGSGCVAVGHNALNNATGSQNVAVGASALSMLTSGTGNVAVGDNVLAAATTGNNNVAVGLSAGDKVTTGSGNVAIGQDAAGALTTGSGVVAIGTNALKSLVNITPDNHLAIGVSALENFVNTSGRNPSMAIGASALNAATTGYENVAFGPGALTSLTTGSENVAIGSTAGAQATTCTKCIFIGKEAGSGEAITGRSVISVGLDSGQGHTSGSHDIYVGEFSGAADSGTGTIPTGHPTTTFNVTSGSGNVFIGSWSGLNTNDGTIANAIAIGQNATVGGSNRIVLGNADHTDVYCGSETAAAIVNAKGMVVTDAGNFALGTGTGTKIGTATGQKLAFWNQAPVVQQVLATGAGATADNVISLLQTLGLCKQS